MRGVTFTRMQRITVSAGRSISSMLNQHHSYLFCPNHALRILDCRRTFASHATDHPHIPSSSSFSSSSSRDINTAHHATSVAENAVTESNEMINKYSDKLLKKAQAFVFYYYKSCVDINMYISPYLKPRPVKCR